MNASPNPFRKTLSITFLEDRLAPAGTGLPTSPYLPPLPTPVPIGVIGPPCQPASESPAQFPNS